MKETGAKLRIVDLDAGFLKSTTENPAVVFQTPLRRQLGTTSKRVVRLPDAVNSDTVIGPREAFFLRQAVEATPTTTFFGSPPQRALAAIGQLQDVFPEMPERIGGCSILPTIALAPAGTRC
jgi:hypothetical protein